MRWFWESKIDQLAQQLCARRRASYLSIDNFLEAISSEKYPTHPNVLSDDWLI